MPNLKNFPKIKISERVLSMVQDNIITWTNTLIVAFSNLKNNTIVLVNDKNELVSSTITPEQLDTLNGIELNTTIQEQIDTVEALVNTKLTTPVYATFTPTVTLVGGAGNTVPVYTTNSGRYYTVGNIVFVDVYLDGDGGAEGAGTGQIHIALPTAASASQAPGLFMIGSSINGATERMLLGSIAASASVVGIAYPSSVTVIDALTGGNQNNTTRTIRLKFFYEI